MKHNIDNFAPFTGRMIKENGEIENIADGFTISDKNLDAFSRLRTSSLNTLLDAQNHYGQLHQNFTSVLTSGGLATDSAINSSIILSVTSVIGSKAINRSRRCYYVAGQSHLVAMTANFGLTSAGIRKRVGYFDNDDGVFFENNSGIISLVLRTSTSGVASDTNRVLQNNWNIDKMDGAGQSGIIIDWTKVQIFMFDLQWLGAGRVRCFIDINGRQFLVHEFLTANKSTVVYMQTPHLHCSYEIENISSGVGDSMMQICSSVFTEGAIPISQVKHSISNGVTGVVCASGVNSHILSIRPNTLFKGRANKGMIIPLNLEVFVEGVNNTVFQVLEDSVLTAPTWNNHPDANSMVQHCIGLSAGGITTLGRIRDGGYVSTSKGGGSPNMNEDQSYKMQIMADGTADTLSIVAAGIGGNATVYAKITWNEIY